MRAKAHIPNLITLLNLFCGCAALVFTGQHDFQFAFWFVCLGIFLDFFDGFFARLWKVSGPLGVQLDSLADMVTSGVVPGYVMYQMLISGHREAVAEPFQILPYAGFIITMASCYRLAKFNIDTRQTSSFIGLPTPANALFIISLPVILSTTDSLAIVEILNSNVFLLAIIVLSSYMLNAEIPLFSLKIKFGESRKYLLQYVFLALSVVLLILLQFAALPLIIIFYVLLSAMSNFRKKKLLQ